MPWEDAALNDRVVEERTNQRRTDLPLKREGLRLRTIRTSRLPGRHRSAKALRRTSNHDSKGWNAGKPVTTKRLSRRSERLRGDL